MTPSGNSAESGAQDVGAPETGHAECTAEKLLGMAARDRLRTLMGAGDRIEWDGPKGSYGRELATVWLPDGRDEGALVQRFR